MILRKILVGVLVFAMVSPAWGGAEPLGSVVSSTNATVRDLALTPGSTVFVGDVVSVEERGATRITLASGAQAEILGHSSVRMVKDDGKVQMIVDRGQASFHTSGNEGMSARIADATVRPANSAETSAVIQSLSETHVIIAAEKGTLLVTTSHDGKVYTVSEGEAADLSAADDPQNAGPAAAGKAAPAISPSKKIVIWTVVIVAAAVAVTSYLLLRKEVKPSTTTLQNEISPANLN